MARARRRSAVYRSEYQSLIRLVREARDEAGLTQGEVAKALGRPVSFVSKCELGERRIDPVDLQDFADVLGKPVTYFYRTMRAQRRRSKSERRDS